MLEQSGVLVPLTSDDPRRSLGRQDEGCPRVPRLPGQACRGGRHTTSGVRMKVTFVTSLFSPFQLETARAINSTTSLRYEVLFSLPFRAARGSHWQEGTFTDLAERYAVVPEGHQGQAVEQWLLGELRARKPEVVIAGALHGPIFAAVKRYAREAGVPWGNWMEQPDRRRHWLRRLAVRAVVNHRLASARFTIGIGERAEQYYAAANPRSAMVTYGEDLAPCYAAPARPAHQPMTFVYSGQLLPRQNIGLIMAAATEVLSRRGDVFRLVIAAKGQEQGVIDEAFRKTPGLQAITTYDRDYVRWQDRLRPIAASHVLVYPSLHSGWGLVIPEAMASGLKVITTRMVEAARYFIRDGDTGVLIEPTLPSLVREWERCLDDPEGTRLMGERARESARRGESGFVARELERALLRLV